MEIFTLMIKSLSQVATVVLNYAIKALILVAFKTGFKVLKEFQLERRVRIAVRGAEQKHSEPKMGQIKKQCVVNYLRSIGIDATIEALDLMIENMVIELNLEKAKLKIK